MKKLKPSDINVTDLVLKAVLTRGFRAKMEFESEDEAKLFFDRVKKKQEEILNMGKVDWNNPILRKPMDI